MSLRVEILESDGLDNLYVAGQFVAGWKQGVLDPLKDDEARKALGIVAEDIMRLGQRELADRVRRCL